MIFLYSLGPEEEEQRQLQLVERSKLLPFKPEEQSQLQLVEREEIDDEDAEDLFETIDKLGVAWNESQLQLVEGEEIDEEDEEDSFDAIDNVTSYVVNAGDVKKLQDTGIYMSNGLMMHTEKSLTGIKELSEAKVDKICEAAEKFVSLKVVKIGTGSQALDELLGVTSNGINPGDAEKLQDANGLMNHTETCLSGIKGLSETKVDKICEAAIKIPTGTQSLEALLGGAIETLQFTEAFGEFRSGKKQLAHTLYASTQLPANMKRGKGKAAYIDRGTFRPDRIEPISERFGMVAGALVDNIMCAWAYTYEHQYDLLLGPAAKMSEEPVRLPIMDSSMGLLRVDFTGRGELAERQQKLDQMFSRLAKLDQEASFDAIDKVTSYVVNAGDVKKLQDTGIYMSNGLMMHTEKSLTGIKELSEVKVDEICEAAEKYVIMKIVKIATGSQALDELLGVTSNGINAGDVKKLQDANSHMNHTKTGLTGSKGLSDTKVDKICESAIKIPTGSQSLEAFVGGAIETLQFTEAFGEFRSGKTQLAHTLCISTQLPNNMKRGNGKVALIDRDGTFGSDHIIVPTAERFGMDAGAVLDNIMDSIMALIRVDFMGRGELAASQQKLAQIFSRLTKTANYYNDAVYMTNQVIDEPLFFTLRSLMSHTKKSLTDTKGPSEAKVYKICEAANKIMRKAVINILTGTQSPDSFLGGGIEILKGEGLPCLIFSFLLTTEAFAVLRPDRIVPIAESCVMDAGAAVLERKVVIKITTGSQALDELLGGGIETLQITEAFGEFRSGKTQLAHTLCVTTQSLTGIKGLSEAKVDKICEAAEKIVSFGYLTGSDVLLRRKAVIKITTGSQALDEILGGGIGTLQIAEAFVEFRSGKTHLAHTLGVTTQQKLAEMLSRLTKIAEKFSVAVYMTNQVIADPGGGHVLAPAATVRLMFRKGKGEQAVCLVFDAPNLHDSGAINKICESGSQPLDEFLGGWVEMLQITEALGEFRSGKTLLAHSLYASTKMDKGFQRYGDGILNEKNLIMGSGSGSGSGKGKGKRGSDDKGPPQKRSKPENPNPKPPIIDDGQPGIKNFLSSQDASNILVLKMGVKRTFEIYCLKDKSSYRFKPQFDNRGFKILDNDGYWLLLVGDKQFVHYNISEGTKMDLPMAMVHERFSWAIGTLKYGERTVILWIDKYVKALVLDAQGPNQNQWRLVVSAPFDGFFWAVPVKLRLIDNIVWVICNENQVFSISLVSGHFLNHIHIPKVEGIAPFSVVRDGCILTDRMGTIIYLGMCHNGEYFCTELEPQYGRFSTNILEKFGRADGAILVSGYVGKLGHPNNDESEEEAVELYLARARNEMDEDECTQMTLNGQRIAKFSIVKTCKNLHPVSRLCLCTNAWIMS